MKHSLMILAAAALLLTATPTISLAQSTDWATKMFDETSHDFGVVARGSDVRHRLKVKNIYKETVHIAEVKTSCGCSAAKPSQETLESLDEAYIEIVMNTTKFSRKKESAVIVRFDAPQPAEVRIPIAAYIRTDVVTDPGSVDYGRVDKGETAEQVIDIAYAGRSDWTIRNVENLPSYLTAQLKEVSRDSQSVNYKLKVILDDTAPVGPFRHQINLVTDDASSPRVPLLVEGEVVSDIVVNPNMVSLGMLTPGQEKTVNVVIRGKKPFKIGKVEYENEFGAFEVKASEEEKTVHVLPITIKTPKGKGTIVEDFSLRIDGREEPVSFKAYCKVVEGS